MIGLTRISTNQKTGPIPVSTSSKSTCPDSCPLKGAGCYAESGPINIHWLHITRGTRGMEWTEFLNSIRKLPKGTLWRHNQAGDLEGKNEVINKQKLCELVAANKGRRGFAYTHYPMLATDVVSDLYTDLQKEQLAKYNRSLIKYANKNGFTINISANNPKHAKKLRELNIAPVVAITPIDFQTNKDIVICPAATRENVNCLTCGLCQKQRNKIVGFRVHGIHRNKINV